MGRSKGVDDAIANGEEIAFRKHVREGKPDSGGEVKPPPESVFPADAIPEPVRTFVEQVARVMNADVGAAGMMTLTVAGGLMGRKCRVVATEGWEEYPSIWTVYLGASGTTKSPLMKRIMQPAYAIHDHLQEVNREAERAYQETYGAWKKAKKDTPGLPVPDAPKRLQLLVDDFTMEALAEVFRDNPNGVICAKSEYLSFVTQLGQYKGGKGSDRQNALILYDGDRLIRNRNAGSDSSPPSFFASLGCTVPSQFRQLNTYKSQEGDGLMERIWPVFPEPLPAELNPFAHQIDPEATDAWDAVAKRLYRLGGTATFGDETRKVFVQFCGAVRTKIASGDLPPVLQSAWKKLESGVLRVVLILHGLETAAVGRTPLPEIIAGGTMQNAVRVIQYVQHHLDKTHSEVDPLLEAKVKDFAKARPGVEFNPNEVRNTIRPRPDTPMVRYIIRYLVRMGHLIQTSERPEKYRKK